MSEKEKMLAGELYNAFQKEKFNMLFICYPKCSTCQKARKLLESKKIDFKVRDIVMEKLSKEELDKIIKLSQKDINKFFNTSGIKYREMGIKDKLKNLNYDEKLDLLASDGMLIKRPILISEKNVLIGFKQLEWESL